MMIRAGGVNVAVQFLIRSVPVLGEVWYCPKGPGVTTHDAFLEIIDAIRIAKLQAIFVKLEPEIIEDVNQSQNLIANGLIKSRRDLQSKSTIFIDLSQGEDATFMRFNQGCRRSIRKSINSNILVEAVDPSQANLNMMFELMKATEARAGYGLRPEKYFKDYWSTQCDSGQGQLLFAQYDHKTIAGIFVSYLGDRAWYKDGGSFDIHRNLQGSYGLQWQTMKWLIERGIKNYDLVGVPNPSELNTGNSRQGLYDFKSKFNPEITEFIGCYDLPITQKTYSFWVTYGERIAAKHARRTPQKFLY